MLQGLAAYQQYRANQPIRQRPGDFMDLLAEGARAGGRVADTMSQLQMRAQQMKMQQQEMVNKALMNAAQTGTPTDAYAPALNIIAKEAFLNKYKPEELIEKEKEKLFAEKWDLISKGVATEEDNLKLDKLNKEMDLYNKALSDKGIFGLVRKHAAKRASYDLAKYIFEMGKEGILKKLKENKGKSIDMESKIDTDIKSTFMSPLSKMIVTEEQILDLKRLQREGRRYNPETGLLEWINPELEKEYNQKVIDFPKARYNKIKKEYKSMSLEKGDKYLNKIFNDDKDAVNEFKQKYAMGE